MRRYWYYFDATVGSVTVMRGYSGQKCAYKRYKIVLTTKELEIRDNIVTSGIILTVIMQLNES